MNTHASSLTLKNGTICKKKNYSSVQIEQEDLDILLDISLRWLFEIMNKTDKEGLKKYEHLKLLGVCLCQGSALHFIEKGAGRGLNDFDVWLFFEKQEGVPDFPVRQVYREFFPTDKFGLSTNCINKTGRRIDILGRSINESISDWLHKSKNKSAQELRKTPVILLKKGSFERLI